MLLHNDNESTFDQVIQPYDHHIKNYCRKFATNEWEADDLYQESLIKIYLSLKKQRMDLTISKKYLYTIIRNTWIDSKRKKEILSTEAEEFDLENIGEHFDTHRAREILEVLSDFLNIKQFVVVLLSEVFAFTAAETAELINESESNVYTTLHRTKKHLRRYLNMQLDEVEIPRKKQTMDHHVFEKFLNGFRQKNPREIYEAYLDMNNMGIHISKATRRKDKKLCFYIKDPDGNLLMICT